MKQTRYILLALLVIIVASCQVPFSPEDLTVTRTITVDVIKEPNTPVNNARVDWAKVTGANAPLGGTV